MQDVESSWKLKLKLTIHIAVYQREIMAINSKSLEVKVVVLGDSTVGKSAVVIRFVKNEFDQYKFPTIGGKFTVVMNCVGCTLLV